MDHHMQMVSSTPRTHSHRYARCLYLSCLLESFRSFFTSIFVFASTVWRHGVRALPAGLRAGPKHIALASVFQGLVMVGFPGSFQLTSAAKALLLISLNPLRAGLLGWRLLGDVLPTRTVVALCGALISVGFIIVPPAIESGSQAPLPTNASVAAVSEDISWRGDLLSFATGACLAAVIASSRYGAMTRPNALMALAPCFGSLLGGVMTLLVACAVSWEATAQIQPLFWPIMIADAACIATTTTLALAIAPKYITTAEVALVLLVENIFGPLWVFLAGFEAPTMWTLVGGALLIISLGAHEVASLAAARREELQEAVIEEGAKASSVSGASAVVNYA